LAETQDPFRNGNATKNREGLEQILHAIPPFVRDINSDEVTPAGGIV
jgi:hypothetical protein